MDITGHAVVRLCFPGSPDDGRSPQFGTTRPERSSATALADRRYRQPRTASTVPRRGRRVADQDVTRTLDFTSIRHRVAHSEKLDFTSAKFGLYQRAWLPAYKQSQ
jgi:hypothetical protein